MVLRKLAPSGKRPGAGMLLLRTCLAIATAVLFALPATALAGLRTPMATVQEACGVRPLDVVIVIDRSRSMNNQDTASGNPPHTREYFAKAAAVDLVNSLDAHGGVGDRHHVGLTSYGGTTATVNVALGTSSASTLTSAINGLGVNSGTPLKKGMASGAADMTAHKRSTAFGLDVGHVIIFLSDGSPNPDPAMRPSASEISDFKAAADEVFSIALGEGGSGANGVDLALMQDLAKGGAGHFYHVTTGAELPDVFSKIYEKISCPTPTPEPTPTPTPDPTPTPTDEPTPTPTDQPTPTPTDAPTPTPTDQPTPTPTDAPTPTPTDQPTPTPTDQPTPTPTDQPTPTPTATPTGTPDTEVTPTPTATATTRPTPTPSGTVEAGTGTPRVTPPSTDTSPTGGNGGPANFSLILGLLSGLALIATMTPASLRRRSR
jgi:Mg-chelatase subunit ChlD